MLNRRSLKNWDIEFKLIYKDNQYEIADVRFNIP